MSRTRESREATGERIVPPTEDDLRYLRNDRSLFPMATVAIAEDVAELRRTAKSLLDFGFSFLGLLRKSGVQPLPSFQPTGWIRRLIKAAYFQLDSTDAVKKLILHLDGYMISAGMRSILKKSFFRDFSRNKKAIFRKLREVLEKLTEQDLTFAMKFSHRVETKKSSSLPGADTASVPGADSASEEVKVNPQPTHDYRSRGDQIREEQRLSFARARTEALASNERLGFLLDPPEDAGPGYFPEVPIRIETLFEVVLGLTYPTLEAIRYVRSADANETRKALGYPLKGDASVESFLYECDVLSVRMKDLAQDLLMNQVVIPLAHWRRHKYHLVSTEDADFLPVELEERYDRFCRRADEVAGTLGQPYSLHITRLNVPMPSYYMSEDDYDSDSGSSDYEGLPVPNIGEINDVLASGGNVAPLLERIWDNNPNATVDPRGILDLNLAFNYRSEDELERALEARLQASESPLDRLRREMAGDRRR